MAEIQVLTAWLSAYVHETRSGERDERGEIAQTVILIAIFAAAAIAIATIIVAKFTNKAKSIPTG